MKRRKALKTFGLSSLGLSVLAGYSRHAQAQDCTSDEGQSDDGLVDLLFVQEAEGVKFENERLTMVGLNPKTMFFSDRPDDIAGFMGYDEFVSTVSTGPDNFNEDPPNATLIVFNGGNLVASVLELSEKPSLENGDLVFPQVKLIEGEPPVTGTTAVLFIDSIGRPLSPVSVAGVHRRHRRRRRAAIN